MLSSTENSHCVASPTMTHSTCKKGLCWLTNSTLNNSPEAFTS